MADQEKIAELYDERYQLMIGKITELSQESGLPGAYGEYMKEAAGFIRQAMETYELCSSRFLINSSEEELKKRHDRLYGRLDEARYEESFLNPVYAKRRLGKKLGGELCALYADLLSLIPAAYELRMDLLCIWSELTVELFCLLEEGVREHTLDEAGPTEELAQEVKSALVSFYHDDLELFVTDQVAGMVTTEEDFLYNMVMFSDLSDDRYLYQYGSCIGRNETGMAGYLRTVPQEEIDSIARVYTEGFARGFEVMGKDLSRKKTVSIHAPIGMERVVRAAIGQFKEMGLHVILQRERTTSLTGRGGRQSGIYSSSVNPQFLFDHREDKACYLTKAYAKRRLEAAEAAFETYKKEASLYSGPALIEVFGEEPFEPEMKPEALRLSKSQNALHLRTVAGESEIQNRFVPGKETGFTIIAFPLPSIGERFQEIFEKTVEINALDYQKYQAMQQRIIDMLDEGCAVRITGRGKNRTDLTVALHRLLDPARQTNFENCVADVNIPLGEVFTSPVLEGTNGLLHVSGVYLKGNADVFYRDLTMEFTDGMVTDYGCANFEDAEKGRQLIFENILNRHASLPMGEFAIGTNTTAYKMALEYGIMDKLPILIAEKTGPHFAVGDTCYSYEEDEPMYNPDGKEVIARDNSISALRKEDESKAYFHCHTDITIPYHELGDITVLCSDGRELPVIRGGRFVVPGTEELNDPLDDRLS